MKRLLLAIVTSLITAPVSAAEIELWQGLWSGMTKAQAEQKLKVPYTNCEQESGRVRCNSSIKPPLGDSKAKLSNVFTNGKLTHVVLLVRETNPCSTDFTRPGIESTPELRVENVMAYKKCLKPYEAKDQEQLKIIIASLKAKYGEPTVKQKYSNNPEWLIKGRRISLNYFATGMYGVSYSKDETYDSL